MLLAGFLGSACYHKSLKNGPADDIDQIMLCPGERGSYLITKERLFYASSKSDGFMGTYISGISDFRFSVRDVLTGKLLNRVLVEKEQKPLRMLGYDGKLLWCYGEDRLEGLHARDPLTFGIVVTQKQILRQCPEMMPLNSSPLLGAAHDYFYDNVNNRINVVNQNGALFSLDPKSLRAVRIKEKPAQFDIDSYPVRNSGYLWMHPDALLSDYRTEGFSVFDHLAKRNSQLESAVLVNRDPFVLGLRARAYLKAMEKLSARDTTIILNHLSLMSLNCDSDFVYTISQTNTTDSSSTRYSKVKVTGETRTVWSTVMPGLFYDPSKGIKRDYAKESYKAGNPVYAKEYYALAGKVIVGIKMLRAFGLDMDTGKVLWNIQL